VAISYSEGLAAFTALQRKGYTDLLFAADRRIPSRLVIFQNEGHAVIQDKNLLKWYQEIIDWITQWTHLDNEFTIEVQAGISSFDS